MPDAYPRVIVFDKISNFRDLGGYLAGQGKRVAWRRLFRSGDLIDMTEADKVRFKDELKIKTVIDLINPDDTQKMRESRLLEELGVKYFNIPVCWSVEDYYQPENEQYVKASDMGAMYLYRISNAGFAGIVKQSLEIIADPKNHPLLFHCGRGKDRTGVLAAILLSLAAVADKDIIADYVLTDEDVEEFCHRLYNNPDISEREKKLLAFTWRACPEYMKTFLDGLRRKYGGVAGYLKKYGADKTLVKRLEKALVE